MKNNPFGFEEAQDSPGFLLWQTTVVWQRLIKEALEPYGISHAQFVVMAVLLWFSKKDKAVTQVNIIGMSKLDKMTVSKSLKKLVSLGLVVRHEKPEDTRAKLVQLTKAGIDLACKLVPLVESVDEDFFGKLPKNQEKDLIVVLRKLTETEDVDKA